MRRRSPTLLPAPGAGRPEYPGPATTRDATARPLDDVLLPAEVVSVCDQAHEELGAAPTRVHWSITALVPAGDNAAFDHALEDLSVSITRLAPAIHHSTEGDRP